VTAGYDAAAPRCRGCIARDHGSEPKTYERRRSILEGIIDLRMNCHDGDLEIEGKVPMPASAPSSSD
jgi:hypothetical protein